MGLEDHPAIKWAGIIVGIVLPILLTCGAVWWFLQDQRLRDELWFEEDVQWNADLIDGMRSLMQRQGEITEELATQTIRLYELEAENKLVLEALINMQFSIGKHEGRHDAEQ